MSDLHGSIEEMALAEIYKDPLDGLFKVARSFRLTPSFGVVWYTGVDLGFPEIRSATRDNPDSSGTYDETAYHGARAVSLDLIVLQDAFVDVYGSDEWDNSIDWNSDSYWVSRLGGWMSPELRPRLYFRMKGQSGNARFLDLRPASMSPPIGRGSHREVQLQFVNPSGKILDFDETTAATRDGRTRNEIRQSGVSNPGRTYPEVYPKSYPDIARGSSAISYSGTVSNSFIARIWSDPGVATVDPRITVTGEDGASRTIGFSGLTIPAGQFIEIDTGERTVNMNGNPDLRQNQYLAAPLAWPVFKPGLNQIDFTVGAGGSVGTLAYVETLHYAAYLA